MVKKQNIPGVYIETSVVGGMFDKEFRKPSAIFFQLVQAGRFDPFFSELVSEEIAPAPSQVKEFYSTLVAGARVIPISREAIHLRNAYIEAGIVSSQYLSDALHVALATVWGIQLIVSWNFRHIVHFDKIPKYNAVNVLNGFSSIAIYSPMEVIEDEDEE